MARNQEGTDSPRERGRRPHHIANIAHHFLSDDDGRDGGSSQGSLFNVVIGGAKQGALIARVSALLATQLAPAQVLLMEDESRAWSMASHLSGLSWEMPEPGLVPPPVRHLEERGFRFWKQARQVGATPVRDHHGERSALLLNHLGVLNNSQLTRLEAAAVALPLLQIPGNGCDVLVWCLERDEATAMGAGYTLGRAVQLLRPSRLEVLLLDRACADECDGRAADPQQADLETRCRELFQVACTGSDVQVHVVPLENRTAARDRAWLDLGQRIMKAAGYLSD